jgi:hypothetical protein
LAEQVAPAALLAGFDQDRPGEKTRSDPLEMARRSIGSIELSPSSAFLLVQGEATAPSLGEV